MAIQMRRGLLADYDETKMLAGEWGISIDNDSNNQKAFIAFGPGESKEVMLVEDAEAQIQTATQEAIAEATQEAEAWAHGNSFDVNDYASGDGSTTAFTLAETPSTVIGVYVDGETTTAYTLSGTTITFTTAPASGTNNIRVNYTVDTTTDNAKYYKQQAANSATTATTGANTATNKASAASTSATNAHNSELAAAASATNAHNSELAAAASAASIDVDLIQGNVATIQDTEYASRNFNEGEFIVWNGLLYKVTTDTAAAEEWEVGVNIARTTAGAEITTLNNSLTEQQTVTVTDITSTTSVVSGNIVLVKCGKVRMLTFNDAKSDSTGIITFPTFSSSDRPATYAQTCLYKSSSASTLFWVRTNGTTGLAGYTADATYNGTVTWITA